MDWRGTGRTTAAPKVTPLVPVAKPTPVLEEKAPLGVVKPEDKWEGEDEFADGDSVKDNWDDEDEEIPPPTTNTSVAKATEEVKAVQIKSKKGKNKKKFEDKRRGDDEELTATELEAIKLREEKLREAEELRLTKEAFGISSDKNELLDIVNPITKDDFDGLRKKIIDDLGKFSKRSPYQDFIEELIVDLAVCLPAKRLKKVKTSVEVLYFEKSKTEKTKPVAASGKGASSKGVKLNVEGDRAILKQRDDDYEDFDDFM